MGLTLSLLLVIPLWIGYLLDLLLGDPYRLPHPVRFFGNTIQLGEKWLNKGGGRFLKGMLMAIVLTLATYCFFGGISGLLLRYDRTLYLVFSAVFVFYGLANKSLIQEGRKVFDALAKGIEAGRERLSWIVGRDTAALSEQQIRKAVFETMSENLSDGVIAPLFYYLIAGVPGMMAYKMINTLDSMVGYRNERYEQFGKFSARLDDVANFIPSRLTALLMVTVTGSWRGLQFVFRYGRSHKSPNSGYPEAALAGICDVQFGGPNLYHGILVEKPYIGINNREISHAELNRVKWINHLSCLLMLLLMTMIVLNR